jgi:hypothetical protein
MYQPVGSAVSKTAPIMRRRERAELGQKAEEK